MPRSNSQVSTLFTTPPQHNAPTVRSGGQNSAPFDGAPIPHDPLYAVAYEGFE
jgi:hypothetical protein